MTHAGYIKRQNNDVYSSQRRGGKGIIGMTTKETDFVEKVIAVDTHSLLMMFTNTGRVYTTKAYRVPEAGRTAKGTNIVNLLEMSEGEKITAMIAVGGFAPDEYLLFVTKNGTVKRTALSEFEIQRKGGKIALSLDEGDELVYVRHTTGSDDIIIATHNGNAVRFAETDARVMGRTARGVRGIRLEDGDFVVGCALVDDSRNLVTVTEGGFGKRSSFEDFACKNRGGKGVKCHNISEKTGALAGIATVDESDDLMLITSDGTVIRLAVSDIPVYSRAAGGVIVMRLSDGDKVVNFAVIEEAEEDDRSENVESVAEESEENVEKTDDAPDTEDDGEV